MKLFILTALIAGVFTSSCTKAQTISSKKILIVYLSRTNNTKAIAEIIQQQVGGKLVALELENPYPENYQETVQQVVKENETGFLPALKTSINNIERYDVIFIGFPTWGMKIPPPMKSFLKQYDLAGKTIIPFNTNAGYGVGSGFQTVKDSCKGSKILEGFELKARAEKDGQFLVIKDKRATEAAISIKQWLKRIEIKSDL